MSFNFRWPTFSPAFHADAVRMLDGALNRGPKPKVIADDIRVHELGMGTIPPELEILEIGDLSTDRFRGIFRLTYAGDAHLVLSTKVQANPLAPSASASPSDLFPAPGRGILFAAAPLIVPMQLRLSAVRLKAIVVLVVSRQKGITLVFKNDPLESVDVSSTFDSVAVIQKYLQSEIEGQLREMFREDLPGIIHRLSQRWLSSETERVSGAGGDAAAASVPPAVPVGASGATAAPPAHPADLHAAQMASSPPSRGRHAEHETASAPGGPSSRRRSNSRVSEGGAPPRAPASAAGAGMSRSPSSARNRRGSRKALSKAASTSAVPQAGASEARYSFGFGLGGWGAAEGLDDIESYDPTYGLRPDALRAPPGSGYSGLARLATQAKGGLRDLTSLGSSPKANTTGSWAGRSPEDSSQAVLDESDDALDEAVDDVGTSEEEDSPLPPRSRALEHELDLDGADAIHGPDSESDEEHGAAGADLSRFGYPPPSAAFSDTAVEASVRRSASLFGGGAITPASPAGTLRGGGRASSSVSGATPRPPKPKPRQIYDTIPAVGGGTVTQPRVYHIASRVQAPEIDDDEDDEYESEEERTARLARSNAGATSAAASSTVRGPASVRTFTLGGGGAPSVSSPLATPFQQSPVQRDSGGGAGRFDSDESGSWDESTSRHSHSNSLSGDGSLATLEPEPMDPRSSAFRTQLYRARGAGFYRAGYGSSSETASQSGSASLSGTTSSSRSRSGVYYGVAAGPRPSLGRHTPSHSTAPTSQYPSTHDIASSVGGKAPLLPSLHIPERPGLPQRPMSLDASAHLAELVNSNHTLSPYTRTLETRGFAVRSAPVTPGGSAHASGASTPALSSAGASQYSSGASMDMHAVSAAAARSRAASERGGAPDARPTPHRRRTFKLGGGSSKSDVSAAHSDEATPTRARPGMQRAATDRPVAADARSSTSWGASERSHRSADSSSMRRAALLQQQQLAQQQQQGSAYDDEEPRAPQQQQQGFAAYAGNGPKSFAPGPGAEVPVRRRSGRAFVPPSEAALAGAARWAAIRE